MKKYIIFIALLFIGQKAYLQTTKTVLPNGWTLSPIGKQLPLGDLPLNIVVSADKSMLAVTNNGQSYQSIQLFDTKADTQLAIINVEKSWYGLAFTSDNNFLYASGGNDNRILKYDVSKKSLKLVDSIYLGKPWPVQISPAGLCLDEEKNIMYVVTKEDNSLYTVDLSTKKSTRFPLESEAYSCILSKDKKQLYITLWGADRLLVFNTESKKVITKLAVGDNPNELLLTKDGKYLYVANSNDNSVSVVNTQNLKIVEVLNAALYPNAPNGSSTNGLALSEDEKQLYIANASNNCLSVFNVQEKGFSKGLGFIPVGWYPTNVKVINKKLYVSNAKGLTSLANPKGPAPTMKYEEVIYQKGDTIRREDIQYIGGLFKGTLSVFPVPNTKKLASLTKLVYENTPYTKEKELEANGEIGNPIPMKVGDKSPIKHVFYIVKENRTYDQVLSDLPGGNGDTSLLLFGRKYTPNQHAVCEQFVLLDNFYVDAEVSADGHNWSTAAYANDYTEKNWPTSYGGRGGNYDFEGQKRVAYPKGGFIWDHCLRAGITFRSYGEFADDYKANIPVLEGKICKTFTSWDESVPDTTRFKQWKHDFDSLLAINQVPQLNTLRFINDHTEGLSTGRKTPFAHVADNDYAVGLFIEYLSKSSIWDSSAVFILEDDAQNGPDHVDAHRSTAYVAGGYVKRGYVDHTMYSTSGMLRTIELILGMPPMSQYDAAAEPMWRCFNKTADKKQFKSIKPNINLNEINTVTSANSKMSDSFDFTKEDRAPDLAFNKIIWQAVRGENSEMPAPKRSAFLMVSLKKDK
jgi:YVTN family beta-propeller protein